MNFSMAEHALAGSFDHLTRCETCGEPYEDNGPCACPDPVCDQPHATEAEARKCAEDARWLRRNAQPFVAALLTRVAS